MVLCTGGVAFVHHTSPKTISTNGTRTKNRIPQFADKRCETFRLMMMMSWTEVFASVCFALFCVCNGDIVPHWPVQNTEDAEMSTNWDNADKKERERGREERPHWNNVANCHSRTNGYYIPIPFFISLFGPTNKRQLHRHHHCQPFRVFDQKQNDWWLRRISFLLFSKQNCSISNQLLVKLMIAS